MSLNDQNQRCTGRCSGCALKTGAKANTEIQNRLTATLAALGGIPFYCHEQMGWTPDQKTYPDGQSRTTAALDNLMSAPKLIHNSPEIALSISDCTPTGLPADIFDEDRALIGKTPVCVGWKIAVQRLAKQGWFHSPESRKLLRETAKRSISALDRLKDKSLSKEFRKKLHAAIHDDVKQLRKMQKELFGGIINLESE